MPSVGTASLDLEVDRHQVGRAISGAVSANKGIFSGLGRSIGGLLAGGIAAAGIGSFLKDSVGEAREAAKIGRLTEQVVKSTGKAANVSAGQVGKLAEQLSNIAGIDDEIIQGGANVLLTFTNIRNQVGKGNNIFDQATASALDMSVALGTDLQGSIIQVGKALNDPIKGVTALQRVGVSFTQSQKDQIKTLVESGRTMDAQKLILAELSKEFGGAAAAGADAGDKASVAWGNLKEQLGTAVLPTLERVGTWIGNVGVPAISKFGSAVAVGFSDPKKQVNEQGWIGTFTRIGQSIREFVDDAKGAARDFLAGFREGENGPDTIFGNLGDSIRRVVDFVRDDLLPTLTRVASFLRDNVAPTLGKVLDFVTRNLDAVVAAWVTFKTISITSAIVTGVAGAWSALAGALGLTAVNATAASTQLGVAGAAATTSGAAAGASAVGWAGIIGAGVGLGVVLHNLIETHFPGINRALEDFGGHVYDFGTSVVEKFKDVWESIHSRHVSLDVDINDYEFRKGLDRLIANVTSRTVTIPVNLRPTNAQALFPGGPTTQQAPSNRQSLYPGKFHSGGIYRAPTPGGEGLALLRDREAIFTPEQMRALRSPIRMDTLERSATHPGADAETARLLRQLGALLDGGLVVAMDGRNVGSVQRSSRRALS